MSEPIDLEVRVDPDTLHESYVDPDAARERADALRTEIRQAPDEIAELTARGDLVVVLRILGEPDDALREANAAADRADIAGNAAMQHAARVRLAHVHQWRGDYADANVLFTELGSSADRFGPVIEAFTRHHAGLNSYDQGHWDDAVAAFGRALELRADLDLDEAAESRAALEAAHRRQRGTT